MAVLRTTQPRGDRELPTKKETPAEKLRAKALANSYNIDSVVPATPLTLNVEPSPEVAPINLLPNTVSQNPSDSNKLTDAQLAQNQPQQNVTDIQGANTQSELATSLSKQRTDLEKQIEDMSRNMANLPAATIAAKNKLGINEEQNALNTLRSDLSKVKQNLLASQDKEVAIGERGLQRISDFAGTAGDFGNLTTEALRSNRLDQLTQSRTLSRFGDTVNNLQASIDSNVAAINENAKAEQAKLEFDINQKNAILDRVIQTQGTILSDAQKANLETVKFQNELTLADKKAQATQKQSLLTALANDTNVNSADLARYAGLSYSDISNDLASKSPASTTAWINYTPEEALTKLDDGQYSRWETYNGLDEATKKSKISQEALVSATGNTISLIDDILDNVSGMDDSVGTLGSSRSFWPGNQADVNRFRSDLTGLSSVITLDTLKNLKASGATLGAISEKELKILQTAGTRLGLITDSDGNVIGRSELSTNDFKNRVKELQDAAKRINILNEIGEADVLKYKIKDISSEALSIFYNDMKAGKLPTGNWEDEAASFIKEKEGFSAEPYKDITGKTTVGYGTTDSAIASNAITAEQADKQLKEDIKKHSTWIGKSEGFIDKLSDSAKVALSSFEYNLGSGIWNTTGKPILAALEKGNLEEARRVMLAHNKARVDGVLTPIAGLTNRRGEEAQMINFTV